MDRKPTSPEQQTKAVDECNDSPPEALDDTHAGRTRRGGRATGSRRDAHPRTTTQPEPVACPEQDEAAGAHQVEAPPEAADVPEAEQAPPVAAPRAGRRAATEWSVPREGATTVTAAGAGEFARRGVKDALDRETVIAVARHTASNKTAGMTDEQVLLWLIERKARRDGLAGHVFERLDARDMKRLYTLRLRHTWLQLCEKPNEKGIDGTYRGARRALARRTVSTARTAQHKLTEHPTQLKTAASKVSKKARSETELVTPRGVTRPTAQADGLHGFRQGGWTIKDVREMVESAANPDRVTRVGAEAAKRATVKAGASAAAASATFSVACDTLKVHRGDLTVAEAAENAAWAGGEAAIATVASAAVTKTAAPTIAAGVSLLAGSTIPGTTAIAAGLAVLGPVSVGIGTSAAVSVTIKKVRKLLRAASAAPRSSETQPKDIAMPTIHDRR